MALLEVEDLTITLSNGDVLLREVNLSMGEGEILTIVGPSGSGKSTLLKVLAGHKKEGIHVEGRIATNTLPVRIPQEPYPRLLFGTVEALLKNYDLRAGLELLEELGITHLRERKINTLSYGEKKILSILTALLSPSRLIMLDEPFSGLDDSRRERLKSLIEIERSRGRSFILVDHTGTNMGGTLLYIDMEHKKLSAEKKTKKKYEFDISQKGGTTLLEMKEIRHRRINRSITLHLTSGGTTLITGDNGTGKTTLLNIIAGWEKAESGQIIFRDTTWEKLKDRRGKIFYVSQYPESSFHATTLAKMMKSMQIEKEGLRRLGLEHRLDIPVTELSFGEKIKTNLLMADNSSCDIILIDEVFSSLDHRTLKTMYEYINRWQEMGRGIIITSPNTVSFKEGVNLNG